jgi:hypothetical protein
MPSNQSVATLKASAVARQSALNFIDPTVLTVSAARDDHQRLMAGATYELAQRIDLPVIHPSIIAVATSDAR